MKNPSLAVLLLNADCRVVAASYERDDKGVGITPYTQFKTFSADVKIGDYVVVPTNTRHGFTVVRVEAVDVEWDPDSSTRIEWIVDVVSTGYFEDLKQKEQKALDTVAAAEKRKKREELAKTLTEHMKAEEVEALKLTGPAAPQQAAE